MVNNDKDLLDKFLGALHDKIPGNSDLTNTVSTLLNIERDSAYRRLSGKVNFSVQEMGVLSKKLGISLDNMVKKDGNYMWFPFFLEQPLMTSIDILVHKTLGVMREVAQVTANHPTHAGNVYNMLPLEFYLHSPVLTKFMFFKWGHYFIGTDEYNNFSQWTLPAELAGMEEAERLAIHFKSTFYVLDDSIIWTHLSEVENLYRMRVITSGDRQEIRQAFIELLNMLENLLNGTHYPEMFVDPNMDFYISSRNSDFVLNYYVTETDDTTHFVYFQTNYSYSTFSDNYEKCLKIKTWLDSIKSISTLLSKSGRVERRIFFDTQRKLVNLVLGNG